MLKFWLDLYKMPSGLMVYREKLKLRKQKEEGNMDKEKKLQSKVPSIVDVHQRLSDIAVDSGVLNIQKPGEPLYFKTRHLISIS
jgi:hypothetical protein